MKYLQPLPLEVVPSDSPAPATGRRFTARLILGLLALALAAVAAESAAPDSPTNAVSTSATADRLGELITIPEGSFTMGNKRGPIEERPEPTVHLPTYQIGKYEVTRGEYRRFIEAGGYKDPKYWSPEGWVWKEGNAYEWTSSWANSHPGSPQPFDHTGKYLIVKGGCWDDIGTTSAFRAWYLPPSSSGVGPGDSDYIGFRVARSRAQTQ